MSILFKRLRTQLPEEPQEIAADKELIKVGWDIKWVFKGYKRLSKGLRKLLDDAKIPYEEIQ